MSVTSTMSQEALYWREQTEQAKAKLTEAQEHLRVSVESARLVLSDLASLKARVAELREAALALLKHCDVRAEGETQFERDVTALRTVAIATSPAAAVRKRTKQTEDQLKALVEAGEDVSAWLGHFVLGEPKPALLSSDACEVALALFRAALSASPEPALPRGVSHD